MDLHILKDLQRKRFGSVILKDLEDRRVNAHVNPTEVYAFVNRNQEKSGGVTENHVVWPSLGLTQERYRKLRAETGRSRSGSLPPDLFEHVIGVLRERLQLQI